MSSRIRVLAAILVLLVAAIPTPAVAAEDTSSNETYVRGSFENTIPLDRTDGSTFVWASEPNTLRATYYATNVTNIYKICVRDDARNRISCRTETTSPGNQSVEFRYRNLSSFDGTENVTLVLYNEYPGRSEILSSYTFNVTVIEKTGDIDGDRLTNAEELDIGASMFLSDTDSDSLSDGTEVNNYGTSPLLTDTDGDGLSDAAELSSSLSPTDRDTDGDGIPDGAEVQLGTDPTVAGGDADGDGLSDYYEYAHDTDPLKADTDGDGLSDGMEAKLHTKATDGNTLVLLLFTGATLLGVAFVAVHRYAPTERSPRVGTLVSNFPALGDVDTQTTGDSAHGRNGADHGTAPRETDRAESRGPSELILTDEDRIFQILRENGGWVYQGDIVDRTDWSKSKVSRLLSRMADEETIEKISVGRQNIIAERGSMPAGANSPFDE